MWPREDGVVASDVDSGSDLVINMISGLSRCKESISMDGLTNYSLSNHEYNIQ